MWSLDYCNFCVLILAYYKLGLSKVLLVLFDRILFMKCALH